MRTLLILPVKLYKIFVSPLLTVYVGKSCRYSPTCSQYAEEAIRKYGLKGVILAYRRILRCNWKSTKFYDPVT